MHDFEYQFPKSRSKNLQKAVKVAEDVSGFEDCGDFYRVKPKYDELHSQVFKRLVDISAGWKGSCFLLDGGKINQADFLQVGRRLGDPIRANTPRDWLEKEEWYQWGRPEDLVVGESFYQDGLRSATECPVPIACVHPVNVVFKRDPSCPHDSNALMAVANSYLCGHLPRELAAVVSPIMDEAGVDEIVFAGIFTGIRQLRLEVWPNRPITDGFRIQNDWDERRATWWSNDIRSDHKVYLAEKSGWTAQSSRRVSSEFESDDVPGVDAAKSGKQGGCCGPTVATTVILMGCFIKAILGSTVGHFVGQK